MLEPKVPAIGASVGFVLSFLIGLISRASFFAIFSRALCMAVLFGLLAVLARVVILRFIPELLEEPSQDAGSDESVGNVIDITVGEGSRADSPFESFGGGSNGMVPDFIEQAENDLSEFPERETARTAESVAVSSGSSPDRFDAPVKASHGPSTTEGGSMGGLDVLPDLQDFVPQNSAAADTDPEEVESSDTSFRTSDSIGFASDIGNSSMESDNMAKAIRTILSRDK